MVQSSEPTSLRFDIAKLRDAIACIDNAATVHEGLYRAFIEDLQWVESLDRFASHLGSGLELIATLAANPDRKSLARLARETIRELTADEAGELVYQIHFLLAVVEQAACRREMTALAARSGSH